MPRFGILYVQSNSGKTLLLQTVSRLMFGNAAPTPMRANMITAGQVHAIDGSYLRIPATVDDLGPKPLADHVVDIIEDETTPSWTSMAIAALQMVCDWLKFKPFELSVAENSDVRCCA